MRTQKHDLKYEILYLEAKLQKAILDKNLFEQQAINNLLDIAKSTLINIR